MTQIKVFNLKNTLLEVNILNIGATLYELKYKGKNKILSYDNLEDYRKNPIMLGSIVGRVAGRISNAKFKLNGITYKLDNNESNYSIHGGNTNLSSKFWEVESYKPNFENPYIILKTTLKDGDSGYPGNVDFKVKYILIQSTLRVEIFAKTDKDTIVNVTNHAYFNLNEDKSKSIKNHKLMVNASNILEANDNCIPLSIMKVDNTDLDLRKPTSLELLDNLTHEQTKKFNGYDHAFILNGNIPNISIENEECKMIVNTSYPSFVIYSGNAISNNYKLNGTTSFNHQGICFEAQYEPDFINKNFLPNYILRENEESIHFIEYNFK